jgi:uncharacterized LabA/DUF88 family protein
MFKPQTDRIMQIAKRHPDRIAELELIFDRKTNVYIDYANVKPWATKLQWHVDIRRLKQFLNSFDAVSEIKLYQGTLVGDEESEKFIQLAKDCGYCVRTKPVQVRWISIDVSSLPGDSTERLGNFIRGSLLRNLKVEAVEYLNTQLRDLNKQGTKAIRDRKCNFDVEIGREMLNDYDKQAIECFVLWSGDSDFAGPLGQILEDGKKAFVFATVRKVASELNELVKKGLFVYDIQKIRNFICWKKEIDPPL